MSLRRAPALYSQAEEQTYRADVERELSRAHKKGQDMLILDGRLVLKDRTTGALRTLVLDDGVLGHEPYPG